MEQNIYFNYSLPDTFLTEKVRLRAFTASRKSSRKIPQASRYRKKYGLGVYLKLNSQSHPPQISVSCVNSLCTWALHSARFRISGVNNGLIKEIQTKMTTVRPFTCDDMFTFNNV